MYVLIDSKLLLVQTTIMNSSCLVGDSQVVLRSLPELGGALITGWKDCFVGGVFVCRFLAEGQKL